MNDVPLGSLPQRRYKIETLNLIFFPRILAAPAASLTSGLSQINFKHFVLSPRQVLALWLFPNRFWLIFGCSQTDSGCFWHCSQTDSALFWPFRAPKGQRNGPFPFKNGFFLVYSRIAEIRGKFDHFGHPKGGRSSNGPFPFNNAFFLVYSTKTQIRCKFDISGFSKGRWA